MVTRQVAFLNLGFSEIQTLPLSQKYPREARIEWDQVSIF